MLEIIVPQTELFDENSQTFLFCKETPLTLEHSLVSISKWESKWHEPFLVNKNKTDEQMRDYCRCMTITQHVDPVVYQCLSNKNLEEIAAYMNDPMTATTISKKEGQAKSGGSGEIMTSELLYYYMITLGIPVDFQKWHLNRLIMLINVCNEKNKPAKKMSASEIAQRNRALNASRRKRLGTKG